MKTTSFILTYTIVALVVATCGQASAALVTSYTTSIDIPDYNPKNSQGISDTRFINISGAATSITGIQVALNIDGGFNGDYYAYLRHGDTGFAVLLNRPGVTTGDHDGYGDGGLNVVFADDAINGDIHKYQSVVKPNFGVALSGTWQPDGRRVDPNVAIDATPPSAYLSSFIGANPNGDWTLFVADNSLGEAGTLKGWGLTITTTPKVTAVPEPSTLVALAVATVLFSVKLCADRQSQKSRPVKE